MTTKSEIKSELKTLAETRERIMEASTAQKLERLTLRERELQLELQNLGRRESSLRSNSPPTLKEQKLSVAIRDSQERERFLMTDLGGILPQKFVRADATSHFHADLAAKKKVLDKPYCPSETRKRPRPAPVFSRCSKSWRSCKQNGKEERKRYASLAKEFSPSERNAGGCRPSWMAFAKNAKRK